MALSRDMRFNRIAGPLERASVGVAADANEIYESSFVQLTAGGFAVKVGDTGGLGVGPVIGCAERNVPDATGESDGASSFFVAAGLFERPVSSTNPVTEADMFRTVYAADDAEVTNDATQPVLGTMVGFNPDRGTDGYATVLIGPNNQALSAIGLVMKDIALGALYESDGTALAAFVDGVSPTPGLSLNDSEAAGIRWNNDAAPGALAGGISIPDDLDDTRDAYLIFAAAKVGATAADVPTLGITAFFQTVGADYDADADAGGDTNAMTNVTKQVQALVLTIAAANIPAGTNRGMSFTITPEAGKLTTDDLILCTLRLAYFRKI